ncbi:hypothetical protein BKP37_12940 [Anaerobacillus alkalilacustris]|uniref:IrrE N-terminal-like domain-containing protein n=1 Tax=Anaerobacillus alkalilacustris TaxID=393763 RepID=A0A1S2LKH2_9BACI|nr:ImmA/IrrE family metallo-endopeptidase [Anaerobacillus alkalilacustris]OIJ12700.1 hypothetical protein BKP37_12940 [Anaerobacillus alkalilacustris]
MRFISLHEEKLTKLYQKKGIITVSDLSISNIADSFNILIKYHHLNSKCLYDNNCGLMLLKENQRIENERADFFHEMAHFFSHVGDQRKMVKDFVRLQERQAHWISLYASMPRFIFEPILNETRSLKELVEVFQLPETMIKERIRIIRQQNSTQSYYDNLHQQEDLRINRSLQKEKIYDSTLEVLQKLSNQVGEEKLSYEIQSLLR